MIFSSKKIGNGSFLVEIKEELDLYSSSDFRKKMNQLLKLHSPQGIILSLKDLEYIDSSGVGGLLSFHRQFHSQHIELILCQLAPQCREVIEMTQLDRVFEIQESDYKALKMMNERLKDKGTSSPGPIIIDHRHDNFDKTGLNHKRVNIDFKRIRYISHIITQYAPDMIKEHNLLEQQVSEIIKNAVRHGNKNDINKEVKIWWDFSEKEARLIVEDQGEGFKNVEHWNQFFLKRMKCFLKGDPKEMIEYLSYRTADSTPEDGGNALFAAMEYWNGGFILNQKRNAIALKRTFKS